LLERSIDLIDLRNGIFLSFNCVVSSFLLIFKGDTKRQKERNRVGGERGEYFSFPTSLDARVINASAFLRKRSSQIEIKAGEIYDSKGMRLSTGAVNSADLGGLFQHDLSDFTDKYKTSRCEI
jgi:hypothetical protein